MPQQIRQECVGQLHPLCKAAMMRMTPAVYKVQNVLIPQEKDQHKHQLLQYIAKGAFKGVFSNFLWGQTPRPTFSLFLCFIPQCLKLGSTIAMPSLYRISCNWPALYQAKVGLPPFPRS